jgi:endo-1,4-beta-xylanase
MVKRNKKIWGILFAICVIAISALSGCQKETTTTAADFTAVITWADMFGDQDGTLTVMPSSQTWSLSFENVYGTYEIAGTYDEDGTMTCTDDAGAGEFLPLDGICAAGEEVIKAFLNGETEFNSATSDAQEENTAVSVDFDAFTEIKTSGVLDQELTFLKLPDAYNTYDTEYKGTEIYIEYTTDVYGDGVTYSKFARVYLPYGYDPDDHETKYNILYLQHGNNCSPSNWFDVEVPTANFKTLLDNLFDPEHGVMDPFIIVCPTYYLDIEETDTTVPDGAIAGDGRYEGIPAMYYREVIEDLIPAVESQLNVYCTDFSEEGIKATRDHRAWGGYSRGSVCTWYMFHYNFEYFTYWMPTSANCLREGTTSGADDAEEWTDEMAFEYVSEPIKEHPELDFFIIAQSGGATDAPLMRTQMKYFAEQTDVFSYGLDREENNFYYTCSDFVHVQQYFPYYLYTAKDILFK